MPSAPSARAPRFGRSGASTRRGGRTWYWTPSRFPLASSSSTQSPLVVHGASSAAGRDDELARDRPGLVGGQEHRDVRDLRGVDHPADGVAAGRVRGKIALLDLVGGNAELGGPGGHETWRALGPGRAGVNAVHRESEAAQLYRERLREVNERRVARAPAQVAGVAGVGAADVDDAAPSVLFQVRDRGARAAQRAHVLHVEVV